MLVDTHAHIYLDDFTADLDEVLGRARDAGVDAVVMPAIDVPSIHKAIALSEALSESYPGLSVMAAIHPSETKNASDADFDAVADLCDHPSVVAVGETGLDYYWDRSFDHRQQDFLRRHIRLAVDKDLPIVFHNREAFDDLIGIVEKERSRHPHGERLRGVFHCFTGTPAEAERVARSGFLVGIGGIATFKNAGVDGHVKDIPMDWIVLETDAPYLAPEPHRGKRNEPAHVRLVAEKVASVKDRPFEEVARATTANAARIFGLER